MKHIVCNGHPLCTHGAMSPVGLFVMRHMMETKELVICMPGDETIQACVDLLNEAGFNAGVADGCCPEANRLQEYFGTEML